MFKVIIFDFDGTLHNGEKWENWNAYMKKTIEYATPNLTDDERKKFMEKYNLDYSSLTATVAEALIAEFGTAQGLIDYQSANIYRLDYPNMKFVDPEFLKDLSKKFNLYIVSNSPVDSIKKHFSYWGIDPNIFKEIYFNHFETNDPTKAIYYNKIMEDEKVIPQEILVIGDSYENDLVPAHKLGMQTFLTVSLSDIYSFFENLA